MEFKKLLMGVAASTLLLGACGNVENHEDSDKNRMIQIKNNMIKIRNLMMTKTITQIMIIQKM